MIPSQICKTCPARPVCGAEASEFACPDDPSSEKLQFQAHPQNPHIDSLLSDLGGFDYPSLKCEVTIPTLPKVIPIIRGSGIAGSLFGLWVGITTKGVIRRDGSFRNADEMRKALGLSVGQRMLLSCHVRDQDLDTLWAQRPWSIEHLIRADFDLVLAPGFSVWRDNFRLDQLAAIRKSALTFQELCANGIATIPHFSGLTDHDWRRAGYWLAAHPEIEVACLDFQRSRDEKSWQEELAAARILRDSAGRDLKWVVNGVATPRRLIQLRELLGDFTLLTSDPFMRAARGRAPWPTVNITAPNATRSEVFYESLKQMRIFMERAL